MDLGEIKAYFETNKDNEDVKNYFSELSKVTEEGLNNYISTEEGKKWIGKQNDSFFTKGLESWKKNNLESLIDVEVKKRFPEKDPKDIELEKVKHELAKMQADTLRKELTNKGLKMAQDKKLPADLIDYFIADSEENTMKNLEALEKIFSSHVETLVNERLKSNNYTPPNGEKGNENKTIQEIFKNSLNNF